MSHFSVLTVGDVDTLLAPFHEFECTGQDDQYVKNVDQLQKARDDYSEARELVYVDPEGNAFDAYTPRFFHAPHSSEFLSHVGRMMAAADADKAVKILAAAMRLPQALGSGWDGFFATSSRDWNDGKGHSLRVHVLPEGWTEERRPPLKDFEQWVVEDYGYSVVTGDTKPDIADLHKYGWIRIVDGKVTEVVRRTNPDKKWDWYMIGGRWAGRLLVKPEFRNQYAPPDVPQNQFSEELSRQAMEEAEKAGILDGLHTDQALKAHIDWEGMRNEADLEARERYARFHEILAGREIKSWAAMTKGKSDKEIEACRDVYQNQPGVKELREADFYEIDDYLMSEIDYVGLARAAAVSFFAFLDHRGWCERGAMGWFGCASNEAEPMEWYQRFEQLLADVPDDELITVVDCHI